MVSRSAMTGEWQQTSGGAHAACARTTAPRLSLSLCNQRLRRPSPTALGACGVGGEWRVVGSRPGGACMHACMHGDMCTCVPKSGPPVTVLCIVRKTGRAAGPWTRTGTAGMERNLACDRCLAAPQWPAARTPVRHSDDERSVFISGGCTA